MGDGPGYDYLATKNAQAAERKRLKQKARMTMLYEMLRKVGFGDTDGNNTPLEKEIAAAFERNFELLQLILHKNGMP